jgi:hypothetical protein
MFMVEVFGALACAVAVCCIRVPCYDTCDKCTIFKNSFRYREKMHKKKGIAKDDSGADVDDGSDAKYDEPQDCDAEETKKSYIA